MSHAYSLSLTDAVQSKEHLLLDQPQSLLVQQFQQHSPQLTNQLYLPLVNSPLCSKLSHHNWGSSKVLTKLHSHTKESSLKCPNFNSP